LAYISNVSAISKTEADQTHDINTDSEAGQTHDINTDSNN